MPDGDAELIASESTLDYSRPLAWESAARRRTVSQIAVLSLFALVGLGLLFSPVILWMTEDIWKQRRFEREAWIDAPTDSIENIRGWMVDDLFRQHDFHGMTRRQVENILGPPAFNTVRPGEAFVYHCGPDRSAFGIDSEWVYFKVDDDGKVIDYGLTGD